MKTLSLFLLLFSATAFAQEGGFQVGNDFETAFLEGEITVNCRDHMGGSDFAIHRCAAEVLDPSEFARFQGPVGIDADEVTLKATREDGSTREKSESYDPATGLSKGRFNLWIATLFQRPLLKFGRNAIEYSLTKDGQLVKNGTFTATVNQGPDRYCRVRRHYQSTDMNDCRFSQRLCSQFFYEENYCQ